MKMIVVVRGPVGCGKTTFAAALASRFASSATHAQTLLINTDTHIPAFGLWVPNDKPTVSLGKLMESPSLEQAELAAAIHIPHGFSENLGLLVNGDLKMQENAG